MRVILQQEVANLGQVGDQVVVKPGYGRNYLIPLGKAVRATQNNIEKFEAERSEFERAAKLVLDTAKQRAQELHEKVITITSNAGEGGKLFGSIGPRDIAQAVVAAGFELEKSEVSMPEGPIRQVGEYDIALNLHSAVNTTIKVNVVEEK